MLVQRRNLPTLQSKADGRHPGRWGDVQSSMEGTYLRGGDLSFEGLSSLRGRAKLLLPRKTAVCMVCARPASGGRRPHPSNETSEEREKAGVSVVRALGTEAV